MQPVIKWGRAWLEDNSFDRRARDVALTAALAHCDLAGQPPTGLTCSPWRTPRILCQAMGIPTDQRVAWPASPALRSSGAELSRPFTVQLQHSGWRSTGRKGCRMPQVS